LTPWPLKMKAWLLFVMLGTTNPVIQHNIEKIWLPLCKLSVDKILFWKSSHVLLDQSPVVQRTVCLCSLEVLLSFPNDRDNKGSVRLHYLWGDFVKFVIFLNIQLQKPYTDHVLWFYYVCPGRGKIPFRHPCVCELPRVQYSYIKTRNFVVSC
jgi:hypothetical protein